VLAAACLETSIVQVTIDDIAEVRINPDSVNVPIGRDVQARAALLDSEGALLSSLEVSWTSSSPAIVTVDADGLLTGISAGTTQLIATAGSVADTAVVVVAPAPTLVLSTDAVAFAVQAGAPDPAPDTVDVTNGGVFPLVGLAVDSIAYVEATVGWLAAQLASTAAPTELELAVTTAGLTTAGFLHAVVWVSAIDADDSPASIDVSLEVQAGTAVSIELDAGDAQTGEVGLALPTSPSVLVKDAFDNPVPGAEVVFVVTGGGGSVTGSPDTTSASGIATVGSWVLGNTKGPNGLDATLASVGTVSFTATGVPGPATKLQILGGDGQSAVAGSAVANPPQVVALDVFDNGVEGVGVVFSVQSGGGGITGATQTTDTAGVATSGTWTLGTTAGANTVDAVAAGIPDMVTFSATGLPGGLDEMVLVAGDAQSDTVAATLPVQYAVKLEDVNNNGIPGIPVSWSVTGGGGSITLLDTTDVNGLATATRVLGTAPGTHTAQAAVGGLTPVSFTATATVGTPSKLVAVAGTGQSATVNTNVATPPKVKVTDKFDNPIQGHSVTFAAVNAGATISPSGAQVTAADGTATLTSWKLGTLAATASDTVTVTPTGSVTPNPLRFTATAMPGAAASFLIVQGNGQTANTGSAVSTAPQVRIADSFGNGISGRSVSFSASGSGSVGTPSAVTNSNGVATTSWTLNVGGHTLATNGTYQNTLTASTAGFANVQLSGFARYSYATDVTGVFGLNCASGCHGSAYFTLDRASLYGVASICGGAAIPRVSTVGGTAAESGSALYQRLSPTVTTGLCFSHLKFASDDDANFVILRAWIRNGAPNN